MEKVNYQEVMSQALSMFEQVIPYGFSTYKNWAIMMTLQLQQVMSECMEAMEAEHQAIQEMAVAMQANIRKRLLEVPNDSYQTVNALFATVASINELNEYTAAQLDMATRMGVELESPPRKPVTQKPNIGCVHIYHERGLAIAAVGTSPEGRDMITAVREEGDILRMVFAVSPKLDQVEVPEYHYAPEIPREFGIAAMDELVREFRRVKTLPWTRAEFLADASTLGYKEYVFLKR